MKHFSLVLALLIGCIVGCRPVAPTASETSAQKTEATDNPKASPAVAHQANDAPVTLKRTFKEGAVEQFQNEFHDKSSGMDSVAHDVGQVKNETRSYGKPDKFGTVEVVMRSYNLKNLGGAAPLRPDEPQEYTTKFSLTAANMMHIESITGTADQTTNQLTKDYGDPCDDVSFPSKPVKPGDSWPYPALSMKATGLQGDYTQTFLGTELYKGVNAWHIKTSGHYRPLPANAKGGKDVMAKTMRDVDMSEDITGDAYLDATDGSLLSFEQTITSKSKFPPAGNGLLIGETTTSIKRVP